MRQLLAKSLFLLTCFGLLLTAGIAEAQVLGDASVPFSAARVVNVQGRTVTGRMYSAPGRQRHEFALEGMRQVILLQADPGRGYLVLPDLHSFVEFAFPRAIAELAKPSARGKAVGQETINGIRTTRYKVQHRTEDGSEAGGYLWLSAEGIVMKLDGTFTRRNDKPHPFSFELSNVAMAPQQPALFELPGGMNRLPAGALQPLLGSKLG